MLHFPYFNDCPHIQFPCFFESEREISTTELPERRKQPVSIIVAVWRKVISEEAKFLCKGDLVNSGGDRSKLLDGKGDQFVHMPLDCKGKDRSPFFDRR